MFRRQPTHLPGMLSVARWPSCIASAACRSTTFVSTRLSPFRLAGIIQQIYKRCHHAHTTNPAFKRFWIATNSTIAAP